LHQTEWKRVVCRLDAKAQLRIVKAARMLETEDINRVAVAMISHGELINRGAVAGYSPGLSASETPGREVCR